MSIRDRIMAASDLPTEDVLIPEWDGVTVRVVGLTGEGRANYIQAGMDDEGERLPEWLKYSTPRLLIETVTDPETDERIFTLDDVDEINGKNAVILDRLTKVAARLSGLGTDEETKAEEANTTEQFR